MGISLLKNDERLGNIFSTNQHQEEMMRNKLQESSRAMTGL